MRTAILILTAAFFSLAWACAGPNRASVTMLPAGAFGQPYSAALASAGSWTYSGGALPMGLEISANRIAGTPAETGIFSFIAAQETSTGTAQSAAAAFKLCIAPPTLALDLAGAPTSGSIGVAFSYQLKATGGVAPYSWAVTHGSLPPGLSLSISGLISGKPTMSGQYNFSVTATDSATFSCAISSGSAQTASLSVSM